MDANDLRIFEAVARHGSMSRAARELNTVQSNVTARIRALEADARTALFTRHSRGVALTEAGRRLMPYASQVIRLIEEARRVAGDAGTPAGRLTLGSLETTAALRLSPLLASYAETYPAVDLVLKTGTSCELIEMVRNRDVEGAFVCGPVGHGDLLAETIFREELAILAKPHAGTLARVLAAPDLKIVVLRAGCSYRQRLEEILAKRGIVGLRRLEFGTLEAIFNCVAAGLGITLLPRALLGPVWADGRVSVHRLPAAEAAAETQFVRRRDAYVSSALRAFLDRARAAYGASRAAE